MSATETTEKQTAAPATSRERVVPRGPAQRLDRATGRRRTRTSGRRPAAAVARRNLVFSIFAEHLGFSVWLLWSVSAALLAEAGFAFTPQQLFWLVALPNLVGSLLRLPYTFAVPSSAAATGRWSARCCW